jgi:hypothetical protein
MEQEAEELRKPAGRNRAIIGSMASMSRPGRAVRNSLQDNRRLRDAALAIPRVKAVRDVLASLLELTAAAAPGPIPLNPST